MKRSFTIGRDSQNDIVISDPSDLVSRLHATLKVDDKGHYKIMDQSTNGTYVNGIRLEKFVDVPVTRKDEISLASVAILDWDEVPKSKKGNSWIIALCIAAGLIILGLLSYVLISNDVIQFGEKEVIVDTPTDTFQVVHPAQSVIEWNKTTVEFEVKGTVEWTVAITDKDGKPVEKASVSPASGKGDAKIVVTLPRNTSKKADAVYRISVATKAAVQPQSYELQVIQKKRPQQEPSQPETPKPQSNTPIL